jgi:Zn-dependent protease with chaperone function
MSFGDASAAVILLGMVGLHVFLVRRFLDHVSAVRTDALVPKGVLGGLFGPIGLLLMALTILFVWGAVLLTTYDWFVNSGLDGLYLILGGLLASPIVHLIAEMLVNVSYADG